ncbi:DNA polymerase III subunit alpha [bacterium]|nr:DNA polymerase III subunit alpha [bacterium]
MTSFVHLHNHSQYSLLDGISTFPRIIERLKRIGQNAFALTDHGNLYGAVDFYVQMKAADLHPIIGCEVYVAPRQCTDRDSDVDRYNRHLVLLCMNHEGYRNLVKLVTLGFTVGYYYRPRIDLEILNEYKSGLIALSGCLSGVVNAPLLHDGEESAKAEIQRYANLFGAERFFLELQNHSLKEEAVSRAFLLDQAKHFGLQVVATNDSHYVESEDATAHDIALCLQTRSKLDDKDRMRFSGPHYYIKSYEEMAQAFPEHPQALSMTTKIARQCDVDITDSRVHFPTFVLPEEYGDISLDDFLRQLAYAGARERFGQELPQAVVERLEEELSVIISAGFAALFIIVWDLMRHAREQGIPVGPGRGSAAGVLVSYCLYITKLDPLAHGLYFERFLNKERVEFPDFDLDFCYERREEMIDYVKERYGDGNVAQIITFSSLKARAVVKAVGRVKGYEYAYVDRITKLIAGLNITIKKAIEANPELADLLRRDRVADDLVREAEKLEGLVSHVSVHAAGIVLADLPLAEYVPLRSVKDSDMLVTQYEMGALAKVGLLKFDFLGLKTLTTIDKSVRYVREVDGVELDIDNIPFDDQAVYENVYSAGNCFGVFQFEAPHIVRVMRETHPSTLEDLTALNALNRPGPLQAGMVSIYIANRREPDLMELPLPQLEPVLAPTNGVLLYQEQVMQIAQRLAGYTLGEADVLRKAMGKKILELMGRDKERFIVGAVERGVDKGKALEIWDMMAKFAGYGFNKAHSACYAYLSYQTAYLKHYHPHHFLAALMNTYIHDSAKMAAALQECQKLGIEVVPPSVNLSTFDFVSDAKKRIVFGLGGIKHIGRSAVDEIVRARDGGGPFESVEEFLERVDGQKVNKTALEFMIRAGAFDEFGIDRGELLRNLENYLSRRTHHNQIAMFESASPTAARAGQVTPPEEIARMEKESIGVYLTHNPYERAAVLADERVMQIADLYRKLEERGHYLSDARVRLGGVLDDIRVLVSRRKQVYALARLCSAEHSVNIVVGPAAYERCADLLQESNEVIVQGTVNIDDAADEAFEALAEALKLYTGEIALYRGEGTGAGKESPAGKVRTPSGGGGRLLLKFSRVPSEEELGELKERLERAKGSCPAFLIVPRAGGAPRKISLGQEFTLDPQQSAAATAGLPLTVEHVLPARRRI